ncbi:CDP-diacylglycerol--glycerol-3-phosphate 3-phosphatidyltransferase [Nocardiopsis mwathae]|uniref:CDP-diacylglycerol--glycerol-3-phosphate 3-phosphatidyltransferase n=1 Tax=Nocardiopsis mwathae TaxID=1472723 RepID=A0A7W9YEU0_9ACTN|nr:CDP-alcohol phosphatidyltransferase family protein [Nocardiopsis mwathae]MBB6170610.1 CDP-diacylglycerol--glycerol-3-phosphate 3-phosphatidyltransferase [Nocardiopsis mwathae]
MNGLYALKPWFAGRLAAVRRVLVEREVSPALLTWAGVGFAAAAGAAVALLPAGPVAGVAVAVLLVARLACANLDGGVARESGRSTRFGFVVNELGDRLAEFAVLAGCLFVAPPAAVAGAALAATLPSWVSLAGAAAGAPRLQGGPVGKTERCALLALLAATGAAIPVLALLAAGSLVTAAVRLARVAGALRRPESATVPGTYAVAGARP